MKSSLRLPRAMCDSVDLVPKKLDKSSFFGARFLDATISPGATCVVHRQEGLGPEGCAEGAGNEPKRPAERLWSNGFSA